MFAVHIDTFALVTYLFTFKQFLLKITVLSVILKFILITAPMDVNNCVKLNGIVKIKCLQLYLNKTPKPTQKKRIVNDYF